MDRELYAELRQSLKEATAIAKGEMPAARRTVVVVPDDDPETILRLTDEQTPRFVEAAKAGKGLPPDIVKSFMAQLFPDDQPTYQADDGPLSEAELNRIRAQAAPNLGKGAVLRRRSLLEDLDDQQ